MEFINEFDCICECYDNADILSEKIFNDSIHGSVSLHPLLVQIIDTPQFQRLRFIKQLGIVYFVYPSATHNRFEHSLGVSYLAGQLVEALKSSQPFLNITDVDVLCVKIAGLCHDLGHGPFSHLWEKFMEKVAPEKNWLHEKSSIDMFYYLIESNHLKVEFEKFGLYDQDLIFIEELICGPKNTEGEWPYVGRPMSKSFLYEVSFDYRRMIKFSKVLTLPNGEKQICQRDKIIQDLYDMFNTRRSLHRIAYQHRVVKIIELMIVDVLIYANKYVTYKDINTGKMYSLADTTFCMGAYQYLTDDVINIILRMEPHNEDLEKSQEILNNLFLRKLYYSIGAIAPSIRFNKDSFVKDFVNSLQEIDNSLCENCFLQEAVIDYGMGVNNPIECIYFYSKLSPEVPKLLSIDEMLHLQPKSIQERLLRLISRRTDIKSISILLKVFSSVCKKYNLKIHQRK